MPTRFSLDFAKSKPRIKVGNQSIGFRCNAVKNDLLVKLENRRNKDIDVTKTTSIGGFPIIPYSNAPYSGLNKLIRFPSTNVDISTIWIADYSSSNAINNHKDHRIYTAFDMQFSANDFNESTEVNYLADQTTADNIPFFFNASEEERDITFFWNFEVQVTDRRSINPQNSYDVILELHDSNGFVSNEIVFVFGKHKGLFSDSGSRVFNLAIGQKLKIYVSTDPTPSIQSNFVSSDFRLTQVVTTFSARDVETFPIYECFERVLQHITDTQFPLYSEFFGRTDTPYNIAGSTYSGEDQKQFANIMSGLNLRGGLLFDNNNPLALKFDDLFDTANGLHSIGYEEEIRDGFERIRIENYDYFFKNEEALDLSGVISKYDIETEAMPELAYAQIKSGFKDFNYEVINGRSEYNTEHSRTSVINTETTYDIKSKIRGDSIAILEKISQELTSKDTEEDNELFIIKTRRFIDDWKFERQEEIDILNNTSPLNGDSLNLYYTPSRTAIRHSNRYSGAFVKFQSSFLRFQKSNKLQTLKTEGEGYIITENEDIQVNRLADPIYRPIKHIVTCLFTWDDFDTLMSNPKGYITFSEDIKGYVLSLKKKNDEDKATIEIIEKYN